MCHVGLQVGRSVKPRGDGSFELHSDPSVTKRLESSKEDDVATFTVQAFADLTAVNWDRSSALTKLLTIACVNNKAKFTVAEESSGAGKMSCMLLIFVASVAVQLVCINRSLDAGILFKLNFSAFSRAKSAGKRRFLVSVAQMGKQSTLRSMCQCSSLVQKTPGRFWVMRLTRACCATVIN